MAPHFLQPGGSRIFASLSLLCSIAAVRNLRDLELGQDLDLALDDRKNERMALNEEQGPGGMDLDALRVQIDKIDAQLIRALTDRARLVVEVGRVKRGDDTPIYAPHREQQVLAKVLQMNEGPLSDRTIEAIYRELMSGSFALERGIHVGYLGPQGSFSHMAAVRHFGSSVTFGDTRTIQGVFEEVAKGHLNYGLVPYENSIGGGITDTLVAFQSHDVLIYSEALIEISHCFLSNGDPEAITKVYSKPQIFEQCQRWLANRFPNTELIPMASSAAAVCHAATEPKAAAIGSALAGEIYGVQRLYEKIQDSPNNITRFLVIGKQNALQTGDDKTTLMFVTAHKPGALVDVLAVLRDRGINLSHIEKRPSGRENWEYTFFIDCDAHALDDAMRKAIDEAKQHCLSLKELGSYPRATRVL